MLGAPFFVDGPHCSLLVGWLVDGLLMMLLVVVVLLLMFMQLLLLLGDVDEVAVDVAVAGGGDVAAAKDVVAEVVVADAGCKLMYVDGTTCLLVAG